MISGAAVEAAAGLLLMWAVAHDVSLLSAVVAFAQLGVGAVAGKVVRRAAGVAHLGLRGIGAFPRHVASLAAVEAAALPGLRAVLGEVTVLAATITKTSVSHF